MAGRLSRGMYFESQVKSFFSNDWGYVACYLYQNNILINIDSKGLHILELFLSTCNTICNRRILSVDNQN